MTVYVAMLRGINVGGQKSIKMEDLRSSFDALGHVNPRTYVQSGNVVFKSGMSPDEDLSGKIEARILKDYGFSVVVIIRAAVEMARIVRDNPFLKEKRIDPTRLQVTFLSELPAKPSLPKMDFLKGAPDQFRILGREIYLYCPNGYGRTKLSNNAIEKTLSVKATTRNWNTVLALAKMTSEQI